MADTPTATLILHGVLMSAGSAALGGLMVLFNQGAQWVAHRIKNERLREAWTLASDYAQKVVREVANSYVEPTKAAGQWDEAAAARAKTMATTQLKNMLVAQSDAKVLTLPATTGVSNLDTLAATFVESAVHQLKVQAVTVAAAATAAGAAAAPVLTVLHQAAVPPGTPDVSRETLAAGAGAVPPVPTPAPVAP